MEKKLIALVLIALIGGLGGGYGLGYVIYQPQIQNLHKDLSTLDSKVTSLNSTVEMMENRTWHEVHSMEGFSDMTSGIFQLNGKEVKISWLGLSDYTDAWLEINLCFSNGTVYSLWGSSGVYAIMDAEIFLRQAGGYYLVIYTYQTDYWVTLYDYY